MTPFAVVLPEPIGYDHLEALRELAETFHYGLLDAGADSVMSALPVPGRRTILLGAHVPGIIPGGTPGDAVIIQSEQVRPDVPWLNEGYIWLLRGHTVLDYSAANVAVLRALGVNATHCPVGHVKQLERIPYFKDEDIDVLFVGSMNERRQKIIDDLRARSVNVVTAFNCYGQERDRLISRRRIIINVHHYGADSPFEIVRCSYLASNAKVVVSETSPDTSVDDVRAFVFTPYDRLVSACVHILESKELRLWIGLMAQREMRARPMGEILKPILEKL